MQGKEKLQITAESRKTTFQFSRELSNKPIKMLVPLVLGYVVGAIGVYTLLYKTAPVLKEENGLTDVRNSSGEYVAAEVIELFPSQEERKAA